MTSRGWLRAVLLIVSIAPFALFVISRLVRHAAYVASDGMTFAHFAANLAGSLGSRFAPACYGTLTVSMMLLSRMRKTLTANCS